MLLFNWSCSSLPNPSEIGSSHTALHSKYPLIQLKKRGDILPCDTRTYLHDRIYSIYMPLNVSVWNFTKFMHLKCMAETTYSPIMLSYL